MQKQPKYEINPFIANSRLIKSLNVSSYTVVPTQVPDVKCGKWSMLILTMQYHLKFPRYLSNKLGEVCSKGGKVDDGRLVVVVIIESQEEAGRYGEVQMVCLERGVKNIPCFSVEEARGVLEDFYWVDVSWIFTWFTQINILWKNNEANIDSSKRNKIYCWFFMIWIKSLSFIYHKLLSFKFISLNMLESGG